MVGYTEIWLENVGEFKQFKFLTSKIANEILFDLIFFPRDWKLGNWSRPDVKVPAATFDKFGLFE